MGSQLWVQSNSAEAQVTPNDTLASCLLMHLADEALTTHAAASTQLWHSLLPLHYCSGDVAPSQVLPML